MSALSRRIALSFVLPLSTLGMFAGQAVAQQQGEAPPQAVTVVTLHNQDVELTTTLPGRVLASAQADVRPQVNGIVIERLFEEGSEVKIGDPLVRIDPTTYEAAVAQAEAALAQANATADAAVREAARVAALLDRRVTSEQASDNAIAARDAAQAAVKMAEAQRKTAQIELERTTIRAELNGKIGLAQTSQGALVTAGQATPLAVIRTLDPIYVDVTQSAADLIRWRRDVSEQLGPQDGQTVTLRLADGTQYGDAGKLTAAEPFVNETTGVVTLRLEFDNPSAVLLPGMYVQAVVEQATAHDVILAPQEGVTRDRRGQPIALVVNAQNVVEERSLTVLQDHGNAWIVSEGLKDGDRIVVEGLQRIGAGQTVAPTERAEAAPAAAPATDAGAAPAETAPAPEAPATEAPAADAATPDAPAEEGASESSAGQDAPAGNAAN